METENKVDNTVDHPKHYTDCSLECIAVMELMFGKHNTNIFCMINAFKYMWRYKHKNGEEDLKKARWYLDRINIDLLTFDEHKVLLRLVELLERL